MEPAHRTLPRTVLVVDDSATLRRAIAIELRPLGARVLEAATADEGIRLAREHCPDLITLDIHLPNGSGYEVCEELHLYDETVGIPILMISSQPSEKQRLHALASGAFEYFVKPFRPGELRSFVVELFTRLSVNKRKLIYAIDASRPVRSMLSRLMLGSDYECAVFDEGEALLSALRCRPCDLLLVDLNLPDYAGYELLGAVRRQPAFEGLPIVALTSSGSRKDLVAAFRAGANEVIRKPFFQEELLVRINSQLVIRQMTKHLHEQATLDPLTKLTNRRQLEKQLKIEISRALREHQNLGIMVVDIDHFKRFNDEYGHSVGDEVLRAVADKLQQTVRATDIVARYGGEEFVLLVPKGDEATVRLLADRLRRGVEAMQIPSKAGTLGVTVSIGVATWPCDELSPTTPLDVILGPADDAVYQSKRRGRNCVTFAGDSAPSSVMRIAAPVAQLDGASSA